MDEDFGAQLDKAHQSQIVQLYRKLVASYRRDTGMSWAWMNPKIRLYRWNLSRQIDTHLRELIKQKHAQTKFSRSILSLSLDSTLTPDILHQTVDQLKSFLFAGHDTTSILLQWIFYELSRSPAILSKLRHELDAIFGSDPDPDIIREKLLSQGEDLLNKMSYTSAIIKEILRLYPPSGSGRYTPPDSNFYVTLPNSGVNLCLDDMVVYNCASVIQRDELVYGPTKDAFIPERWLDDPDTSSMTTDIDHMHNPHKIPSSAWRPFERGPRNCIGQELAKIEARVILVCGSTV